MIAKDMCKVWKNLGVRGLRGFQSVEEKVKTVLTKWDKTKG